MMRFPVKPSRRVAFGAALLMFVSLLDASAASAIEAAKPRPVPAPVDTTVSTPGSPVARREAAGHVAVAGTPARKPVWPAAQSASGQLPHGIGARGAGPARVGTLPVLVDKAEAAAPQQLTVQLYDRAATKAVGVKGLLLRLWSAQQGKAKVTVEYGAFAEAYGGGWSSRLRLLRVPQCALTDPRAPQCQPVAVPSVNNDAAQTVTADADLPGDTLRAPDGLSGPRGDSILMALDSGPDGGAGSFSATPLAPSSTWSHGGSHGGFMWSYPMRTPPGAGGPTPKIGLTYSSQSVDGRMAATNNQVSWVGSGFSMEQSYVERRYKACSEDMGGGANNTEETGDLCWAGENATLSLNGTSVELIKNTQGKWVSRTPTESNVEQLTDASFANGDNDNEYWKVTDGSGRTYWFGRNRLPGWTANKPETNSVLTVPVAGNHPNEHCRASTFASSFCDQAWRWSLDYVEDVHGNTMSYWYEREANWYAKNLDQDHLDDYHRAGSLVRIDYGTDKRALVGGVATDTQFTGAPVPMRVEFGLENRCFTDCGDNANWRDTPMDQECTAAQTDCENASPSFWTRRRLSTVTTRVWDVVPNPDAYKPVDRWTLRQSLPDHANDGGLWLDGITHAGLAGGEATLPEVTFAGIQRPNRVDGTDSDWAPAMTWRRINSIVTEAGGQIWVDYSAPDCVAGVNMPAALDNNSKRCYPVKWTPGGYEDPITDYFHKYVATAITQHDLTGGSPPQVSSYEYKNPENLALWHADEDDGFADPLTLSWGQWRGYPSVVTRTGTGADEVKSEVLYFRGMHGDKTDAGTRNVSVQGLEGGPVTDYDDLAGMAREQIQWLGSTVLSASVLTPWRSGVKASRTIGTHTVEARFVRDGTVVTRQRQSDGSYRRVTNLASYDEDYGRTVKAETFGANTSSNLDDTCTTTAYLPDGTAHLTGLAYEVKSWVGYCDTAVTADRILEHGRLYYDGAALGTAATKGLLTKVESVKDLNGGNPLFDIERVLTYDDQGRTKTTKDITGEIVTVNYTPSAGGPVIKQTLVNPLGWSSSVDLDPAWGLVTTETDVNGRKKRAAYDPLGRRTKVWNAGRLTSQTPDQEFAYQYSKTAPTVVITKALDVNGNQQSVHQFYDSWLRPRQSQSPAFGGGAVMTETFYDTAGRAWKKNNARWDANATAGQQLLMPLDADVKSQNVTRFDAAGRVTDEILYRQGVEQWRTKTQYHGEYTTVLPPQGASAMQSFFDEFGRAVELRQFHGAEATGDYDRTRYEYYPTGETKRVIDASGNAWSYKYDLAGNEIEVDDPDKGRVTLAYDAQGRLETTTDARNFTLAYTFDRLNRITSVREGSRSGAKRKEWTYDTPAKGLTATTTRWIGSDAYTTRLVSVDAGYRPLQTEVSIPTSEGLLGTTYTFKATYKANGAADTYTLPAAGGLPEEVLTVGYDATYGVPDQLKTNFAGISHYVIEANFGHLYEPLDLVRSTALAGAPWVQSTTGYDETSGRLTNRAVLKSSGASAYISDATYKYDAAGNVSWIDDNPAGGERDKQCFSYDHLRRLTEAWTPLSYDCGQARSAQQLGGPAPYWQSFGYGSPTSASGQVGNRLGLTEHTSAGEVETTYTHPTQGAAYPVGTSRRGSQPHAVTQAQLTDTNGTVIWGYSYDDAGNMTSRPGPSGQQDLQWDAEGKLASISDSSGTTTYVYDASGNRLLAKGPEGSTLYLGSLELKLVASLGVSATRYYSFNGEAVAQRTNSGLTWICGEMHGTDQIAVSGDAAQTVTKRYLKPFGEPRGGGTWVNSRGFVGGTVDPTGLTHIGAREYDPKLGRFLSVDPVIDFGDPQQLNAYSYSINNPVTFSDPTGELFFCDEGFACGVASGIWNAINPLELIKAVKDFVKLLGNVDEAFKELKSEADKWAEKTDSDALGWVCALSGVCQVWDDCMNMADPFACGEFIGEALVNLLVTAVTAGSGATKFLIDQGKKFVKDLADKVNLKLPSLDPKRDRDGNGNGNGDSGPDGSGDPNYNDNRDIKANGGGNSTQGTGDGGGGDGGGDGDGKCHSFEPSTSVLMADGTTKAIADVELGDKVMATDPVTGVTEAREVTQLHINNDQELADVVVLDEQGNVGVFKTTANHPFWNEATGVWTNAEDLQLGDQLSSADNGILVVVSVSTYLGLQTMHDLTVDGVHTYYVMTAQDESPDSALVHNCRGGKNADGEKCECKSKRPVHKRPDANAEGVARDEKFKKLDDRASTAGDHVDNAVGMVEQVTDFNIPDLIGGDALSNALMVITMTAEYVKQKRKLNALKKKKERKRKWLG